MHILDAVFKKSFCLLFLSMNNSNSNNNNNNTNFTKRRNAVRRLQMG